MSEYKMVQAIRTGFWGGHRRRAGDVFPVHKNDKEAWFRDIGPAPDDVELPPPVAPVVGAAPSKTFAQVMQEQAEAEAALPKPDPVALSQIVTQADIDQANDLV